MRDKINNIDPLSQTRSRTHTGTNTAPNEGGHLVNTQPSRAVETPYQMLIISHIHGSVHQNRCWQIQTTVPVQRCIGIGILLPTGTQFHHLPRAQIRNGSPRGRVLVINAGCALSRQRHRRLNRSQWWRWPSPPWLGRRRTRRRCPSRYPANSS